MQLSWQTQYSKHSGYIETVYDRQAEYAVFLEINVICFSLCNEVLQVCYVGANGHSIVPQYSNQNEMKGKVLTD